MTAELLGFWSLTRLQEPNPRRVLESATQEAAIVLRNPIERIDASLHEVAGWARLPTAFSARPPPIRPPGLCPLWRKLISFPCGFWG